MGKFRLTLELTHIGARGGWGDEENGCSIIRRQKEKGGVRGEGAGEFGRHYLQTGGGKMSLWSTNTTLWRKAREKEKGKRGRERREARDFKGRRGRGSGGGRELARRHRGYNSL